MGTVDDRILFENILELRKILKPSDGRLVKSKISPQDYFMNLSEEAPVLKYPDLGISKVVVNICELISNLLLEDTDEIHSIRKVIVLIFEYYFLVSPIKFKKEGARFVNDFTFMKHFAQYIKKLFTSKDQAHKELGNTLVSIELHNPIKDIDCN